MQKFFAILVAFALIATSAFAVDISAGGRVGFKFEGDTNSDTDMTTGWMDYFWTSFGITTNDENTAGAKAKIGGSARKNQGGGGDNFQVDWAYAWWRPMDFIFLKLGKLGEDGQYWAGNGLMDWDLNSNDSQDIWLGPDNYTDYSGANGPLGVGGGWNPFPGSILPGNLGNVGRTGHNDKTGVQLSILPMDGMHISFGWSITGATVKDVLINNLSAQVAYAIPGAGTAAVSFVNHDADDKAGARTLGVFYGHPLDNMSVNFDASMDLPIDGDIPGIKMGVGFSMGQRWSGGYMGEPLQIRARLGAYIGLADGAPTAIGLDVCPNYDLEIFRIFVPFGFAIGIPSEGDTIVDWSFYPYITKGLGIGDLYFGFTIFSKGDDVGYCIPFGFFFSL